MRHKKRGIWLIDKSPVCCDTPDQRSGHQPIRGRGCDPGDQSEASIQETCHVLTNQRPVFWSRDWVLTNQRPVLRHRANLDPGAAVCRECAGDGRLSITSAIWTQFSLAQMSNPKTLDPSFTVGLCLWTWDTSSTLRGWLNQLKCKHPKCPYFSFFYLVCWGISVWTWTWATWACQ